MSNRPLHLVRNLLSLLSLGFCLLLSFSNQNWGLFSQLELAGYDWRMRLAASDQAHDPRIVVVDIDERSLLEEGQWPWPRARIAQLLDTLGQNYQVGAIGLDILFPEESRDVQDDALLAKSLQRNNVIVAELFQLEASSRPLTVANLSPPDVTDTVVQWPEAQGYIGNTSTLSSQGNGGHISIDVDPDGKVRRLPPLVHWQDKQHNSLALAIVEQIFSIPPASTQNDPRWYGSFSIAHTPPFSLPLDSENRMLIPFRGPAGQYLYVPASDVLAENVPEEILRDRIVLVGSSATGLYDLIATPWSKSYPGVEVHASVLSALMDGRLITVPHSTPFLIAALCLIIFTAVMLAIRYLSILEVLALSTGLAFLWLVLNVYIWQTWLVSLTISPPLLLLGLLTAINVPALGTLASLQRRQIYHYFKDYVPPAVVEKLIENQQSDGIQPERREMTVLFMDIRGFTSISESLTPTQLAELMNQVLSPVTEVIHRHGGTIDKYMGDAVMAFWGAPLTQPEHARLAVQAALEIRVALAQLNRELKNQGYPDIKVGIGINTGNMTVGNMGSDFRVSYTVIGDAVNIAARLESLTKDYQTDILIGPATAKAIEETIACYALGPSVLKGRKQPIHLYKPQDSTPEGREQPCSTTTE